MHHTHIDTLACGSSPVHKLDPRVKLLAVIAFSICVLSVKPTSISILFCWAIGPFALLVISQTPLKLVEKQILIVSPFILVLACSGIFYDKTPTSISFGPSQWNTTEGVLRCFSIIGKFIVTMSTLILLAATTRFNDLLIAMDKLGVPKLLIMQLSFLWRYIFMLIDRASHMLRARAGRKIGRIGFKNELATSGAMIGSLLTSSIAMAARVNQSMLARGFDGNIKSHKKLCIGQSDLVFIFIAITYVVSLLALKQ